MRAFADHHQPLHRCIDQQRKQGLRHVERRVGVPFGEYQQRRHADIRRVVTRLADIGVFAAVEHHAVGRAKRTRILRGRPGVGGERGFQVSVEPVRGHQVFVLARRQAGATAFFHRLGGDDAVSAEGSPRIGERAPLRAQPPRCVEREAVHLGVILRGVERHDGGAPRMAEQADAAHPAPCTDEIHRRADIACRDIGAHDRRIIHRRLVHLAWPRRATIAAHADEIHVAALPRHPVHPRQVVEREIKSAFRRASRAVHEQHDVVRRKTREIRWALVAHVQLHADISGGNHEIFGYQGGHF